MAAPETTNNVTVRKLTSLMNQLWTKIKNALDGKQDDLGISSSGDATKFLNEKGQWAAPAGTAQVQADWAQTTTTAVDYIKNKPQNLVQDASYVHTDNNYTTEDKNKVASAVPTSRTVNGKALSSNISLTASDVGAAESSHKHGNIASNGKSTSEPTSTTKFLCADGSWKVPVKSLQYWSGGSTPIKGVYIGTCNMQNGWNSWITGTMSLTNYHNSNPNASGGKGIALGLFYLWAFRSGDSISAYCRLYSLNARHTNTDLMLVYKKDTSDATTYKVSFYVCFGPGNSSGGTATNQRPFGLGVNYLENHNADIPESLTGITSDIQYDGYYSVFKMPYLSQNASGSGTATKPVYVDDNGNVTECDNYGGGTAVTLNGSSKAASTASFYAPTAAGTAGKVLKSRGSGAPVWDDAVKYVTSIDTSTMESDVLYVM